MTAGDSWQENLIFFSVGPEVVILIEQNPVQPVV